MMDYSSVCYKNSFINQVIARVDFRQFIPSSNLFIEAIEKPIMSIFKRRGKDQIIRFNSINFEFKENSGGIPNANGEFMEGIQREYSTVDGANKLILSNKFIVFEINNYSTFDEHKQWLQSIIYALYQSNKISAERTGIRYINIFRQPRIKLKKSYFAPEIAASLYPKFVKTAEKPCMIRSMHMTEYRVDEMTMNFRFGMFNPEYPNIMKKNDFALDFDFFSNDAIDSAEGVINLFEKGHDEIQSLFEQSITNSLREVMNNE